MKDLIRKILKEENDEHDLEWVGSLDDDSAMVETKESFNDMENEFSVESDDLFELLTTSGVHDPKDLIKIGKFLFNEFEGVNERGVDSGRDSCDCDGCCDDYVWYETYEEDLRTAKSDSYDEGEEAGYERGYESGKEESVDEIIGLRNIVETLNKEIENLREKLGITKKGT